RTRAPTVAVGWSQGTGRRCATDVGRRRLTGRASCAPGADGAMELGRAVAAGTFAAGRGPVHARGLHLHPARRFGRRRLARIGSRFPATRGEWLNDPAGATLVSS